MRNTAPLGELVKSPVPVKEVAGSRVSQPSWHLVLPWTESIFIFAFTHKSEQFRHRSLNLGMKVVT